MSLPPRLAFFGGTFDPIHLGHLEIARKAQLALELDQVIFLPCRQSPHKTDSPGASDQERLEMIKIAIQDIPWAHVSDIELEKPPPSYTWETLREFKNTFRGDCRLFLILGLDQWNSLPRWKHPERLAEDVEFIVIACPIADCGLSGATTTTSPISFITSINFLMPGAVIPSSLVTSIRGFFFMNF